MRRPRFILIDQSLRDNQGHHYSYAWAVAEAARARGHDALIVGNKSLDPAIQKDSEARSLPIRPWFSETWTESAPGRSGSSSLLESARERITRTLRAYPGLYLPVRRAYGALRGLRGGGRDATTLEYGRFRSELLALLRELELTAQDHVFIPTLSNPEARDCFRVVDDMGSAAAARIHLLFRRDPGENAVVHSPVGSLADLLRPIQDSALHREVLRFYTDTRDLSAEYSRMSKVVFETLPLPVRPVPPDEGARGGSERVRLTYFGDARGEKGFHLLPALVDSVLGSPMAGRVKFVIQANPARGARDEAGISEARNALRRWQGPDLDLLEEPLSDQEYGRRLVETDAVIIPYQPLAYRYRSSGILAEALVAGKPVIVPEDTWMAREADPGSSVRFGSPGELFQAVSRLVSHFEEFSNTARGRMGYWRARHEAPALVHALVAGERWG